MNTARVVTRALVAVLVGFAARLLVACADEVPAPVSSSPAPVGCPDAKPRIGDGCAIEGLVCPFVNTCFGAEVLACIESTWRWTGSTCPDPNACPLYPPTEGAPCALDGLDCTWTRGRGAKATCEAGAWRRSSTNYAKDGGAPWRAVNANDQTTTTMRDRSREGKT